MVIDAVHGSGVRRRLKRPSSTRWHSNVRLAAEGRASGVDRALEPRALHQRGRPPRATTIKSGHLIPPTRQKRERKWTAQSTTIFTSAGRYGGPMTLICHPRAHGLLSHRAAALAMRTPGGRQGGIGLRWSCAHPQKPKSRRPTPIRCTSIVRQPHQREDLASSRRSSHG